MVECQLGRLERVDLQEVWRSEARGRAAGGAVQVWLETAPRRADNNANSRKATQL